MKSVLGRESIVRRFSIVCGVLLVLAAVPARADKCTSAKLKAIGKKESGLITCQAKPAPAELAACESKVRTKFSTAFAKAGTCSGVEATCESIADNCESQVAAAMLDGHSNCGLAKLKAAAKLAKAELGCYSKAAQKGLALDSACIAKAQAKFSAAIGKAGPCADGGSPQATVEDNCVSPVATTDGNGMLASVCGEALPTTTTSSSTSTTTTSTSTTTTTSSSTTTTTPPCTGTSVGGFCWFLGPGGFGCDIVCGANGRLYDPATASYAGSSGTNANCMAVAAAIEPASIFVGSATCTQGFGCSDFGMQQIVRCFSTTTASAADPDIRRFCACQ